MWHIANIEYLWQLWLCILSKFQPSICFYFPFPACHKMPQHSGGQHDPSEHGRCPYEFSGWHYRTLLFFQIKTKTNIHTSLVLTNPTPLFFAWVGKVFGYTFLPPWRTLKCHRLQKQQEVRHLRRWGLSNWGGSLQCDPICGIGIPFKPNHLARILM